MIGLLITIVIVGVLLYVVNQFIPMDANVKKILNVVVIVVLCLWLLNFFVGWGYVYSPHPHMRHV